MSSLPTTTNATFDPYSQYISILKSDGTPVLVSIAELDASHWYDVATSINYGSQLGACFVMFFVVLVLTKRPKRRAPIFILNILSLFFGFLRALMFAVYFVSAWTKIYPQWTLDVVGIPVSAYATSVIASIVPLFMTITVDLSLVLQAYTVAKSMENIFRFIIIGLSIIIFLLPVAFRMAVTITNSMTILNAELYYSKEWITMGALVTETLTIWWFSIIFTGKLVYTLWNRHRHGWKQWSGVRILAAMGGCTMIIPSIFAVLEYVTVHNFPEAGSLVLTMVALLLPLSSLWASMAIDEETAALDFAHLAGSSSSNHTYGTRKMYGSQFSSGIDPSSRSIVSGERKGSVGLISPTTIDSRIDGRRDSTEIDLEAMGVRVDKSYTVQSRKGSAGN